MSKRLESNFQEDVIKWLVKNKIWHVRMPANSTFGLPDIIAIKNGIFVGLELKREDGKGKPSGLQKLTCDSIIKEGGIATIISSMSELEDVFNIDKT